MTLIISSICPDGIALVGDGRVVDLRTNKLIDSRATKLFHLGNEIYFGISGNRLAVHFPQLVADAIQLNLVLHLPYALGAIAAAMQTVLCTLPEKIRNIPGFQLSCVVMGYDRDADNRKLTARQFTLLSDDDFLPCEEPGVITMGCALTDEQVDSLVQPSNVSVKRAIRASKQLITEVSKSNMQVGGKVTSFIAPRR